MKNLSDLVGSNNIYYYMSRCSLSTLIEESDITYLGLGKFTQDFS